MSYRINALSRWLWVVALLLSSATVALAQTTVSGQIIDGQTNETLIGANVLVPGTSIGTATDIDGNYELTVPAGTTELQVSYAGYQTQTITLEPGRTSYNLTLAAGELLEEVVVVGYGTQTEGSVSGAVTSVKERDFNQGVVNNPTQLIQGKVAGLQIAQVGGDPNGSPTIRLRGLSTLGSNTQPLIIIDGVIGASLASVDPSDIASINVLKDGSAAAIYGTRASSGVILVTTKQARPGESSVTYRVQGGLEQIANRVQVASADRFVELRGFDENGNPRQNVDFGSRNDLVDEITRNALSHIHNLSFAGGLGQGTYRASLNYRDVEGVSRFSGFDQLNGRLNVTQTALDDMLEFDLTVSSTDRRSEIGFNEAFRYTTIFNPTLPLVAAENPVGYNNVGGFPQINGFDYFNPIAINEQASNTGRQNNLLLSGRVTFRPIEAVSISAFLARNRDNNTFDRYYEKESFFVGRNRNGLASRYQEEIRNNLFELTGS